MFIKKLLLAKMETQEMENLSKVCENIDNKKGCLLNFQAKSGQSDASKICSLPNDIGFLINCNAKYQYSYVFKQSKEAKFLIIAESFKDISGCDSKSKDIFILNSCGKLCNIATVNPNTCEKVKSKCDIWSCEKSQTEGKIQ